MINLQVLDKNKTYSGACFTKETNILKASFWIQISGQKAIRSLGIWLPPNQIPIHSFMLIFENNDWWVYESHFDTAVHKILFYDFLTLNFNKTVTIWEDELLPLVMKRHVEGHTKYGSIDILAFILEYFKNKPSIIRKFDKGLFCTEYVANCQKDTILKGFPNLRNFWELQPVHHMLAMQRLGRKSINIEEQSIAIII